MTRLIFVRHGQSTANLKHIFAGHKDEELTDLGHLQAEKTAEYIRNTFQVDAVYASDLSRAWHTAKHIGDCLGLPVITNPNLREIYAAKWQGMKFDDILDLYTREYNVWLKDIGNAVCTGGESVKQLSVRINEAVDEIVKENDGKTVVIVTHATPIRVLQCKWNQVPIEEMKNISWVPNSSVTVVDYEKEQYRIQVCGEDGYLEGMKSCFPTNV